MAATRKELRQFLLQHSSEVLADWLLDVAKDLPDFRHRLHHYAATHESAEAASDALDAAIADFNALLAARRKLKATEIQKPATFLLASLNASIDFEHASAAMLLVEKSIVALDRLIDSLPASTAALDTLQKEFATLHLKAALSARPDSKALAQSLFQLRTEALGPILPEAPSAYAELLGKAGLAHYRSLLEPAYQVLVNRTTLERRSRKLMREYMNQRVMLYEWTMLSDDVDEQVAILLSMARHPEEVLMIASFLEMRHRPLEAVQTVRLAQERVPHVKLASYLAEHLEQQGQPEEAQPYRWFLFEKVPSLETFDALQAASRERAMEYCRQSAKALYVQLLLRSERLEEALTSARESGVPIVTWVELAQRFQGQDPRLAIQIYFDCVEFAIKEKRDGLLADPASFAILAWQLSSDTATFQVFNARLRNLYAQQKIPAGFDKQLDAAGIPVKRLLQ